MPEAPNEKPIELDGKVVQVLPGTMFRVELANGHNVLGSISGKLRKNFIKIIAGDYVRVEINPADVSRCLIVYRMRGNEANVLRQQQARATAGSATGGTGTAGGGARSGGHNGGHRPGGNRRR